MRSFPPVTIIPPRANPKFKAVKLSDPQWEALVPLITKTRQPTINDIETRCKLDEAINDYLTYAFGLQEEVSSFEISDIFIEMADRTNELISFSEKYLFPNCRKYSDPLVINIVRGRTYKSDGQDEPPLIKGKSKTKETEFDYTNAERNELIRVQIDDWMLIASEQHRLPFVDTEAILKSIHELNVLAKAASKLSPPSSGPSADSNFHSLIARALTIYHSAGGEGFATENGSLPFMVLFLENVAGFAAQTIGYDHAQGLRHRTRGDLLKNQIKEARKKKKLWK